MHTLALIAGGDLKGHLTEEVLQKNLPHSFVPYSSPKGNSRINSPSTHQGLQFFPEWQA